MKEQNLEELKKSVDLLIIIELLKLRAGRKQVREIMGKLNNNTYARISAVVNNRKEVSDNG